MKLFIVAPVNDWLTEKTTLIWAQNAIDFAATLDISAISLLGDNVTRQMVEEMLRPHQDEPGLFCFFDHGAKDYLLDALHQPMIDQHNIGLLKNKFIYAVACSAASGLGPLAIAQGVAGFLGFSEKVHVPLRRDFPKLAGSYLVSGLISMLREAGNAEQAKDFMQKKYEATKLQILQRTDMMRAEQVMLADVFRHNQDYLSLLGDANWAWKTSSS